MDYFGILKRAYEINIKHKFLWIFGALIAGVGGVFTFNPSFNFSGSTSDTTISSAQFETKLADFWANYGSIALIGTAILLFVCLLFFIFSIISQGALIGATNKLDKHEPSNFKIGFEIGSENFFRVWGVAIIYLLMILGSLCLLIIPVTLGIIMDIYPLAIAWGILMFFVCLVFWLLISLIAPYSSIIVVLEKRGVWESIRESLHLFRKKWPKIVVMYLLLMAIGVVYGMAIFILFILIGGIAFMVGMAFWLASMWAAIVYGAFIGLAIIIALVAVNGAFKSFGLTVLVLTYNRLKSGG